MRFPRAGLLRAVFLSFFILIVIAPTLHAQQITRGYDGYRTLTTPHFYIHFPEGEVDFARRVGRIAEKVHAELEPKYRSGASGTHVVLVFDTDTVNAFATPYGIDQIVLFLNNPRSGEFARFDAWMELLFTHEYVHVLSLRPWGADQPTLTFLRILLGFPPNLWSPLGMIEGTPVWEESKSGNGRMEDPLTNMIVRTAVLEDAYPSLAEIMNGSHRWPGYSMPYLYGGRIVGYLAGVYDADAVYDYWMSDSVPFNPNGRLPLNAPLAKLYSEKRERDELEFNQQAEQLRRKGLTAFDRLTRDGYVKRFLYLNDEGDLLYFGSPANYTPGLFRWDAEESEAVHIRRQLSSNGIAWQGGRQIFSEDYFAFPGFGLRYELYDGDSFFLDRIAKDRSISFPALSSNGDRLYYIEHDNRKRYLRSARFNADDELTDEITILEVPFTGMLQYTAVAPDNSSIVLLVREGEKGNGNLVLCRRQTETNYDCNALVHGPGTKVQPRFAPDGNRVYFSSDVDGIYNLYSVDINTRQVTRLTRTLTGFFYPTPAEDKLYAIAYFKEGYDVVAIHYDGLLGEAVDYFDGIDPELREEGDQPEEDREGYFDTEVDTDEELIALGEDDSGTDAGDQDEAINPDDWVESDYIGPFSIRPYLLGLLGPVSAFNLAVGARDPLLRHSFLAGVGPSVPDPLAVAYYDYTRFSTGLSLGYATNYWKRDRASGCLNEDSNPLRFVCDDKYSFFESAYGYLRHTDQGRYLTTQVLLGYVHNKIRNARRLRTVEYDARDLNLSGPSFVFLAGDARYFTRSISPERGWRLSLQTDYFTKPESKDRVEEYFEHQIEYGVAEGGLAFYLPSFWLNHVNYLSAYAYGSYGPDREVQQVRLNRFVRGQEYEKATVDHSAIVFTYEYRLPLYWRSDAFIGGVAGLTLRNVGMSVFFDYGASFDRDIYKEDFTAGAYGVNLLFGLNVAYLHLPEMKLSFARGTGPAGEFQVNLSFNAEFSTGVVGAGGRPSDYDNDALIEPFHRSLPGFDGQAGYFRDRRAGGILE